MRVISLAFLFMSLLGREVAASEGAWSGTWQDSRTKKPSSELLTIDHGNGDVEFQFDLWGGPHAYNSGGMIGHLSVRDGKAIFETTEYEGLCRIEFSFTPKQVTVRQTVGSWAECGFGHSILADGTFVRTSRKVPKFIQH
jgi:hypothetical protein